MTAVPAKRGQWKTIRTADGTEVRAELVGDEFGHCWRTADGRCFTRNEQSGLYQTVSLQKLQAHADSLRRLSGRKIMTGTTAPQTRASLGGAHDPYIGTKKGLIILVSFPDMPFREGHDRQLYNRIANEEGFTSSDGFRGSVSDYFKAQSNGQFNLTFDVVGPYEMPNSYIYYGKNGTYANDVNVKTMIREACKKADEEVNFADYDWDNDGAVDQVFVLYAGRGEATGGGENTIWPHESELGYYPPLYLDNKRISTYACSNEMESETGIAGIGTICHEFSHCLGLPDMYDVNYGGNFGMNCWSVMASGNYNGKSFIPCGYTSYERMYAGWKQPVELKAGMTVTDMKALCDNGETYIMYNEGHPDEYYLFENRQRTGWDSGLPGEGLLVLHVDYNSEQWSFNQVNTTAGHQRCTIIPADNVASEGSTANDPYPAKGNTSLTPTSVPANTLFNKNLDGTLFMSKSVIGIRQNADGTVAFNVINNSEIGSNKPEGAVFYESFDLCNGQGGNDGNWGGSGVAMATLTPDNSGWTGTSGFGADRCAKFGTNRQNGKATTPEFTIDSETVLTFKAAPWTGEGEVLTLSVNSGTATLSDTEFTMEQGKWNTFSTKLSGTGAVSVTFKSNRCRFFLDDVTAIPSSLSAISEVVTGAAGSNGAFYNLNGQRVSPNTKGILIHNGKKFVNGRK